MNGWIGSFWEDLRGVEFTQGYIDAGGIATRYLRCGDPSKPKLVLLHGTGGHAECYSRNLAAHGAEFDTWAIDMIGNGLTDKPDRDYEIPDYVAHLKDLLDAIGAERPHISGESLGGWVAAQFALDYPQRVDRLVLNTTGGATMNPQVMARIKELSTAAVENPDWDRVKARLEWLMADPAVVTDDLVACRQAIYRQPGMVTAMRHILCLQEVEVRTRNLIADEAWARIAAPTLVLWTTKDPTAGVDTAEKLHGLIPGSRLEVMQNCGHWPQFEDAATFNRIHLDFLLDRG